MRTVFSRRPKYLKNGVAAAVLVLLSHGLTSAQASTQASAQTFVQNFEEMRALEKAGARVSGLVVRLRDGAVIGSINPDRRLTPASTSKLVLAAAALEKWGSEHSFVTKFFTTGARKGGVLLGDLIFEGAGDPSLTNEKLWFLATDIARLGIRQVNGDLVLNTSLFGPIETDGNRAAGARMSTHAYDSPLSAVAVNFSVMAVVASPGAQVGSEGHMALEPYPLESVKLAGSVGTSALAGAKIGVTRSRNGRTDLLNVGGKVPLGSLPMRVYRSVSDAEQYSGAVLKAFLANAGVVVKGNVRVSRTPVSPQAKAVAAIDSFPLDWQLRGLFKMSNNFIADMLTLQLDLDEQKDRGATLSGGALKLTKYIHQVLSESTYVPARTKPEGELVLDSGSGLTPENKLSARDLVAVLGRMYANGREFPSFLAALPIPGAEGTIRKRFSSSEAKHLQNRLRAKTGTLTEPRDAVALGGYSRLKDGDWVAFAVVVNGSSAHPSFGVDAIREAVDSDLARLLPPEK